MNVNVSTIELKGFCILISEKIMICLEFVMAEGILPTDNVSQVLLLP